MDKELENNFVASLALVEKARACMTKMTVSLNALDLPGVLKPVVKGFTDEVNGLLSKMPPLDAHKHAQDANYARNSMDCAMNMLQDAHERMCSTLNAMAKSCSDALNAKDTAVNGLVQTAVDTEMAKRIKDGLLFDKATVDGMVQSASNTGRETALNGIAIVTTRRKALDTAKLPSPEDESVLEGDDAAFTKLVETAQGRVKTLGEKGIALNGSPDLVRRLIYSKAFETDLKNVEDVLKAARPPGSRLIGVGAEGAPENGPKKRMVL